MTTRITNLAGVPQQQTSCANRSGSAQGGFGAVLQQEWKTAQSTSIAFSKHAMTRAQERGIEVTPTLMDQLSNSVERAQAKGATNILAFDATRAFIINVSIYSGYRLHLLLKSVQILLKTAPIVLLILLPDETPHGITF